MSIEIRNISFPVKMPDGVRTANPGDGTYAVQNYGADLASPSISSVSALAGGRKVNSVKINSKFVLVISGKKLPLKKDELAVTLGPNFKS